MFSFGFFFFLQTTKIIQKLGGQSNDILTEIAAALARNELKRVRKTIAKLIGRKETRLALFQAKDAFGQNILHICVANCPELIRPLIEKKMDINLKDFSGWSPLTYAARKGDERVFAELLSLGAIPDQVFYIFVPSSSLSRRH
jgi:hypothetical protein